MKDIRIAIVSQNCRFGETERNLAATGRWVARARKKGASLICFPEMNLTGYAAKRQAAEAAEEIPGRLSGAIRELAGKEKVTILAGMAERDSQGRVFASHLVAGPGGDLRVYRKLHIAPSEKGFLIAGESIPLFSAAGLTFGVQLCYDTHFPELSSRMAEMGADAIFMPHASPRGTPAQKYRSWMRHLTARAYDNSLFVIACNQSGDNGAGLAFPGLSLVIGPSGEELRRKSSEKEGMLIADLTSNDLENVRGHRMRYFFPNRRPELYGPALPPGSPSQAAGRRK
jgi:predicted amidohydrolase